MMSQKKKILVVEDDDILSSTLVDNFTAEGFDVVLAKNGEEGLLAALSGKPDLILLDLLMPKMDGITMLQALRKDQWGEKVSVVVLTNLSERTKIMEATESSAIDYLVKANWAISELVDRVKTRLAQ